MLALLMLFWSSVPAHAITQPTTGGRIELGAGLGLANQPIRANVAGMVHIGLFRGQFDQAFSLGRYWEFGVTGRVDTRFDGSARIAPMLELRRGTDLIVAGVSPFVAAGPLIVAGEGAAVGITARGGLNVAYRAHRFRGILLRLEAGADVVGGRASFTGGVLLGATFGQPFRSTD